jgi:hypothetical protein
MHAYPAQSQYVPTSRPPTYYPTTTAAAAAAVMVPSVVPAAVITPAASPQLAHATAATHHHLAHLASTVLASLHHLADVPRRALRRRLHRLLSAAALHPNCTMLGLYYLRRASQMPLIADTIDVPYAAALPEEQFLAAVVLAQKWSEDAAYTCRTWAELVVDTLQPGDAVSDVLARLNAIERALLARLSWELRVDQVEFANWCDRLGRWASNSSTLANSSSSSSSSGVSTKTSIGPSVPPQPQAVIAPLSMVAPSQIFLVGPAPMLAPPPPAPLPQSSAHQMPSMMPRPWSPAYGTYTALHSATCSFPQPFLSSTYGFWAVPGA